ncbi:GNAT family N-acetyltransferase [Ruegeria jejuensis]|uniref:GNAT family N-acetyltransferase n=1 Tax=Ruegeria jejuensis TaxID=3233338 RepID=UPI00355AE323
MTMASDIRRARIEDAADCARVVDTWITRTAWMPRALSLAQLTTLISDAYPKREIWVAGDPIDCFMSVDPAEAKVGALYCLRTGQGIGKALLDIAKAGRDWLWLTVYVPNRHAERFYRREGFVEVARLAPEPPDMLTMIKMEWCR